MKRVFVVQGKGDVDLSPANEYGEVIFLSPQHFQVYNSASAPIREFQANLNDFNDDDFILLMGDPILIGLACAIASDVNDGVFSLLKWDRHMGENGGYRVIKIDLGPHLDYDEEGDHYIERREGNIRTRRRDV